MILLTFEWLNRAAWHGSGWRLIGKILHLNRFKVAAILMVTLGVYASSLSVPIVVQNIVDGITAGKSAIFIFILGLLSIILAITDVLLADIRRSMVISLSQRVDQHISLEIMRHVLGSRVDVAKYNTGEILNRTNQTDTLKQFLIDLLPAAVFDTGGAIIAAIMIFAYSIFCGFSVLLITVVGFLLAKGILRPFHASIFHEFKLNDEKQSYLAETVGGLTTIKALAIEPRRFRVWVAKINAVISAYGDTEHIHRRFIRVMRMSQHALTLAW
jgi:subfamily B ATP-binding cassette protein HlyB/CyaB